MHWDLSISFWDGAIRDSLASWWLRCLFGAEAEKNSERLPSARADTLQFMLKE